MRIALGLTFPWLTCISYRTSRVDRGNLAGVDYCVSRTEINRSVATAFRLRCIEFAWFVLSAGRVRFMRYAITPRSYDKYRRLIFIQPTFHPPSPKCCGKFTRNRGFDGFQDLWRLYLVIEFVSVRSARCKRVSSLFDRLSVRIRFDRISLWFAVWSGGAFRFDKHF